MTNLEELAQKLGIATTFSAEGIAEHHVSDRLIKYFCRHFGFDVSHDEKIEKALQLLEEQSYQMVTKPIYVVRQDKMSIEISVKKEAAQNILLMTKAQAGGKYKTIPLNVSVVSEKTIDGTIYQKLNLQLLTVLDIGYYDIELTAGQEKYQSILAVAPQKCYTSEALRNQKLWGFALQLYAVKSKRNWGVGDLTDLKTFALIAAKAGADIIGLNPINVLSHDFPQNASPYSSVSRYFLNPIYIDVEKTAGFDEKIKHKYEAQIAQAKKQDLIDYPSVYNLKIKVLSEIFNKQKKPSKAFENYKKEGGERLHLFALYQAIYHEECHRVWGGWPAWPEGLKNQDPMALAIFEQAHQQDIEFFKFLQFETERQFADAASYIKALGLKIGLYRDLPVGVSKDSAELWSDTSAYIKGSGAGAPPDGFFPQGQKWCLGAFDPFELKKRAYQPFLDILRANMRFAGALRMDHVMSLMRLFMIKDESCEGTYIYYDFDDMLALVALESHLNKCMIVGESIGNVPAGFIDALGQNDIYAMSVLWAERWDFGQGDFKAPEFYPKEAVVSVGTHDMPPLKMWWFGYEIELKYQLKMIDDAERQRLYHERESERWRLLKVLDENGVWPQDNLRKNNYLYGESYPEGLTEAVHALLAKSASRMVVLQIEDIMGLDVLQNLPGTDRDKYPNWRRKWPVDLEDLEKNPDFIRNIQAVKAQR